MQEALVDFFAYRDAGTRKHDPRHNITLETIFRALDLVPTPILVGMNPSSTDIRSNEAGRALFGGGDRNLSQSAAAADRPDFVVYSQGQLVPPDELPMQRAALTGQPVQAPECELRFDDGTVKYIRGRAVPVFAKDGGVRGSIGVFIDVTESRESEKRHALMTDEVKHRAKNTLALVHAIASFTLKPKIDDDLFRQFEDRLQIIGQSVDVFSEPVNQSQTIRQVIVNTMKRQIGEESARVDVGGPEIPMPLARLSLLGMAIHELTTNACKYGALSVPGGSVTIRWAPLEETDILELDWIERGGPKVIAPTRKGFGSRLLAQILGAPKGYRTQLKYDEQGVECRLYVALT